MRHDTYAFAIMKLTHLHLENFRNYERLDFDFPDEPIMVLNGENAQGKTSFLEAIYLLALTKSFRITDTDFLKQFGKSYFRIMAKGEAKNDKGHSRDIQLEMGEMAENSTKIQSKRTLKKNGVHISGHDFIGHLKVVLFRPEDLSMLTGEPALRRKYLNHILIQTVPGYLRQLQIYQKLLSQRNALLLQIKQRNASPSALDPWDQQLSEAGSALLTSRIELIDFLQNQLQKSQPQMSDKDGNKNANKNTSTIKIDYISFLFPVLSFSPGKLSASKSTASHNATDSKSTASKMLTALNEARKKDIASCHTSIGPHRDDIKLQIKKNDQNGPITAAETATIAFHQDGRFQPIELASRGELRTCLIALKAAEIAWMEHKTGTTPLILLDDIFSELDTAHKADLFTNILLPLAEKTQIIMTVAEGNPLPQAISAPAPSLRATATVRKIHAGSITAASK